MKIEPANDLEAKFECPSCYRILQCESATAENGASITCPFCGKKSELPAQKSKELSRQTGINAGSQYVPGKWRKLNRIYSGCKFIVKLVILFLLFWVLGGGKYNETYFLGAKRNPGFEKTFIRLDPVSAFGIPRMEQKLRASYSYIIVKYHKKTGPVFFERL